MPRDGFRHRPLWLLGVCGLVLAQAGFALAAFGPDRSLAPVLDDQPIVSGRHPLHLYHGSLGAATFRETGGTTGFDPNFQAGYPKTPAFDSGSRPAELFLTLGGGTYSPQAYKLGVLACLLAIPLAFVTAARGVGLPAGAAVLAGAFGTLIGWSGPMRRMLDEGELDSIAAGLAVLVHAAWLVRYARHFDIESWLVLAGVSVAGWYAQPAVWLGLAPIVFAFYFVYAPRRELAWHLGLVGILAAGIAPNLWWLTDWARYWWLAQHSLDQVGLPAWGAVLGSPREYFAFAGAVPFGIAMTGAGAAGIVALWRSGCRCGAGLAVAGGFVAIFAARILAVWPNMTADGPERLAPLALGFLSLPAAFGAWKLLERASFAILGTSLAAGGLLLAAWCDGPDRPFARSLRLRIEPLAIGLTAEQQELVDTLKRGTTTEARILWDDTSDHRGPWNWTALLPVLTGRAYLGGLDCESGVESGYLEMRDGKLCGQRLQDLPDDKLAEFCRWYNLGWVVCRSPETRERWSRLPMAKTIATVGSTTILELQRPRSFVLTGSAKWETCVPNRITLTDVVPDANGEVCLSLHHPPSSGLRAYPSYVVIERSKTTSDPWGHVCLMPHGPVPRVTLVWEP
ncbi:MAG: hypothetical protein U0791_05120 [Gemmataceae bacterium]